MKVARASVSFPAPMLADLKREAQERDMTLSQVIRAYLRNGGYSTPLERLDVRREGGKDDE